MFDRIKAALPLNYALLGNPMNWVTIFLMIAIAGAAVAAIVPPRIQQED